MVTFLLSTWCQHMNYSWRSEGGRWGWEGQGWDPVHTTSTILSVPLPAINSRASWMRRGSHAGTTISSLALSLTLFYLFHLFVQCLLFLRCSSHISHSVFLYIVGKLVHTYFCRCCSFCPKYPFLLNLIPVCLYSPVLGMPCSGNPSAV